MTKSIAYTKISTHRGKPRLWLEGRKLERAGIEPGQKFDVVWDAEARRVVLTFKDEGERTVSRRSRNGKEMPIIDIASSDLEDVFGVGLERAKVVITDNQVVVEIHPDDAATQERFDRLVASVKAGRPLKTGSLAHGGGVIDFALHKGFEDAGLKSKLAFAVEIEGEILDTASTNNPIWDKDTIQIEGPMQQVDLKDLPKIDMLVAGLPCVGASRSGKSKNGITAAEEHPTAGALFFAFLRIAKELNPSIICLENVVEYGKELSATVIRTALSEWGYDLYEMTVGGNDFGALEDRKRLCILAVTKQCPIDVSKLLPIREKEATLGDVMETIDLNSDAWKTVSYLYDKAERDTAAGKGFKMQQVGPESDKVGTIGAGYAKIRSTEPMIGHPDPARKGTVRLLTPKEHAAVKAIPSNLVDGVSNTLAHKILGNSCVFPAFQAIGLMLGSQVAAHVATLPDVVAVETKAPAAPAPSPEVVVPAYAGVSETRIPAAAIPKVVAALAEATQEKGGLKMSTIARSFAMLKPGVSNRRVVEAQAEFDLEEAPSLTM